MGKAGAGGNKKYADKKNRWELHFLD